MILKLASIFSRNKDGATAVELALIAPFLLALLGLIADYGLFLNQRGNMSSAVTSGTRYFMLGGTDPAEAQSIVTSAWENRPDNASVSISETCYCTADEFACNTLCADGSAPDAFLIISARASMMGIYGDRTLNFEDDVRVR